MRRIKGTSMCKTAAFTESQLREEDKVCVWYADPSPFLTSWELILPTGRIRKGLGP